MFREFDPFLEASLFLELGLEKIKLGLTNCKSSINKFFGEMKMVSSSLIEGSIIDFFKTHWRSFEF